MQDQTVIENPFTVLHTDGYGTALSVARGDRKAAGMVFRGDDHDAPNMHAALEGLSAGMTAFVEQAAKDAANVHPTRLSSALMASAARILPHPFRAVIKAGVEARQSRAEWLHRREQVHVVAPATINALTSTWMAATLGQIAERTKTANADALAVLLTIRDVIEIPPEMWSEIIHRYIATAIIEGKRPGGHEFPKLQSPETPFATGVDRDAVFKNEGEIFGKYEALGDRLEDIEASISGLVALIATATEASIAETWMMLTGK